MAVTEAWALLGLEPTDDQRAVRRAYSGLLKQIDVDRDPGAFIRLREAMELALSWGGEIPEWERECPAGSPEGDDPPPLEGDWDEADYDTDEPWRPELPAASERDQLNDRCRELDHLLFDRDASDPARARAATAGLLAALETVPVDAVVETERWLLSALAASIPRSDAAIDMAVAHFGWDKAVRPRDLMWGYDLEAVLGRCQDQGVFERLRSYSEGFQRRALEELLTPGRKRVTPFELNLAGDVRRFLDETLAAHPTIEHDLDRDALGWWRGYFQRRHLPEHFWPILLLTPPALVLLVAFSFAMVDSPPPMLPLPGLGTAFALTLLAILLGVELRFRAAARERELRYSPRRAMPWLAVALALPAAAVLTPFNLVTALGWTALALIVGAGTLLNTRAPMKDPGAPGLGPPAIPGVALVASAAVMFALVPVGPGHAVGPFLSMGYVAYRGHEAAGDWLREMSSAGARAVIAGAGLLALTALVSLFLFVPRLPPPIFVTLVAVAVTAQHLSTAASFLSGGGLEWGARLFAALFYFVVGLSLFGERRDALIVAILVYALAYSLARVTMALRNPPGRAEEAPLYF